MQTLRPRQTYLTPQDEQILAALLKHSGEVRRQAERIAAISTAVQKPKEPTK
jgi:hypothetical protein